MEHLLEVKNLSVSIDGPAGEVQAVRDVSFSLKQVIAKLAVLVRNLEPKQGRIREEHDLWNEKWIIAHVRRTLISYGLYESGKS